MLCLTRKFGESILLSGGVKIIFDAVPNNADDVKVSIQAPKWIRVARTELGITPEDPLAEAVKLLREALDALESVREDEQCVLHGLFRGEMIPRLERKISVMLAQFPEAK